MSGSDAILTQWVLFHSPLDFPGKWVIRRCEIQRGNPQPVMTLDFRVADTREEVLDHLTEELDGMVFLPRHPDDHKSIAGVFT